MSTTPIKTMINCDMGEGLDAVDAQAMPYINCASIACGGHAGNAASMQRTLALAKHHGVITGSHPSYPDRTHFGRVSMDISKPSLITALKHQVTQLQTIAQKNHQSLQYIKPHGALYNDCAKASSNALPSLIEIAHIFELPLMLLAENAYIEQTCKEHGVEMWAEAFIDRQYSPQKTLIPRSQQGAVLDSKHSIAQATSLITHNRCQDSTGEWLDIRFATLCVHSDTPSALTTLKRIHKTLHKPSA